MDAPASKAWLDTHRPVVLRLAIDIKRRYRLDVELDELLSAGYEGLLQADRAFDNQRGVSFTTFAYYRIRGAILDNCRQLGLMRRSYVKKARFEQAANEILAEAAGESRPAESPEEKVLWFTSALDDMAVAFHLSEEGPQALPSQDPSPEAQVEADELKSRLQSELAVLTDEERTVLGRYYFKGEPMSAIAQDVGLSVSWVSRVHTRALKKLRGLVMGRDGPRSE